MLKSSKNIFLSRNNETYTITVPFKSFDTGITLGFGALDK